MEFDKVSLNVGRKEAYVCSLYPGGGGGGAGWGWRWPGRFFFAFDVISFASGTGNFSIIGGGFKYTTSLPKLIN